MKYAIAATIRGNGFNAKNGTRLIITNISSEIILKVAGELKNLDEESDYLPVAS